MPDSIRHPVLPLDSGVRRNDKHKVFIRRINKIGFKCFKVLTGEAGKIFGFPTSLDCVFDFYLRRTSWRLGVFARVKVFL